VGSARSTIDANHLQLELPQAFLHCIDAMVIGEPALDRIEPRLPRGGKAFQERKFSKEDGKVRRKARHKQERRGDAFKKKKGE
jgi:hypothetical protein